jgi:hypothetical protein
LYNIVNFFYNNSIPESLQCILVRVSEDENKGESKVYAKQNLLDDPSSENAKRNPCACPGEELYKNSKKDFNTVDAIIEIFKGELVN